MAFLNTNFLQTQCFRVNLSERVIELCAPFSCGNQDLDDFFASDYTSYSNQLLGKPYAFVEPGETNNIVCAFTVSNASIFTNYLPNARKKKVGKDIRLFPRGRRTSAQVPSLKDLQTAISTLQIRVDSTLRRQVDDFAMVPALTCLPTKSSHFYTLSIVPGHQSPLTHIQRPTDPYIDTRSSA